MEKFVYFWQQFNILTQNKAIVCENMIPWYALV